MTISRKKVKPNRGKGNLGEKGEMKHSNLFSWYSQQASHLRTETERKRLPYKSGKGTQGVGGKGGGRPGKKISAGGEEPRTPPTCKGSYAKN